MNHFWPEFIWGADQPGVSRWDHDVFPFIQKSLVIWFLAQVALMIAIGLYSEGPAILISYRVVCPLGVFALALFLSASAIRHHLGRFFPLVFIILLIFVPLGFSSLVLWKESVDTPARAVLEFVRAQPMIYAGMVFTGWFYGLRGILVLALFIVSADSVMSYFIGHYLIKGQFTIWQLLDIHLGTIILVGYILSRMSQYAKKQGDRMAAANQQLVDYSDTLEQLAANRERTAMAREIHDTLAHSLTALTVQLEVAKALMGPEQSPARDAVQGALDTAREGLAETRFALKNLRSARIEKMGLVAGLDKLVGDVAERVEVFLSLPDPEQINAVSPELQNILYRIAQEAVHNVIKHAAAANLSIRLECRSAGICLEIRDDGRGFEPGSAGPEAAYGLRGMKERARLEGGVLNIHSRPGAGTVVVAEFFPEKGGRYDPADCS